MLLKAEAALRVGNAHQAVELTNALLDGRSEIPSSLRGKGLLIRSAAARLRGFPQKALEDASAAMAILEGGSSPVELLIEGHKQVGIVLGMTGELDGAIEHLEHSLRLCAKSSDLDILADIQHALGVALAQVGQLSEAQVHFNSAKAAYQKLGNKTELGEVFNNMGQLHHDLGEYELALVPLQRGLQLARESKYGRIEAMTLITIGDTLQAMRLYDDALDSYQNALHPGEEALEPRLFCCANAGIGNVYRALEDFKKARFYLKQATYEAERLNLSYELAVASLDEGVLACCEGNYGEAKEKLVKCVTQLQDVGAPRPLVRGYLYLALAYFRTKRWVALNGSLATLAKVVEELDMTAQLAHEAKAVPDLINYAASKRLGGKLFGLVRARLQGKQQSPVPGGRRAVETASGESPYPRVEVYSLGRMEVVVDGRKIRQSEWESQKAKELFLHLMSHRNGQSREELLEVLWPEISASLSRNAFYNNVYRTRRALYKGCIVLEESLYRLNPRGDFWFDVEQFQQLTTEAEKLPEDSESRASLLNKAIELYRGNFLAGFYADWIDALRLELEVRYSRSLAQLSEFHAARGDYETAVDQLDKLLAIDSTDVEAHERIIRLLLRSGNRVEARRRHNAYLKLMGSELGPELCGSFEALCRDVGVAH